MKLKIRLPKQYNLGNLPGAFVYLYGNASGIVGIFQSIMSAGTFYIVLTLRYNAPITLWQFYLALGVFVLSLMILVWMFITPSQIAVSNSQAYKHENPAMDLLREIKTDQKAIMERLDRIEK